MKQPICTLHGQVVSGKQVGRTLGFPTANLSLLPPHPRLEHGVYGVTLFRNGQTHAGVMNVGRRPTFHDGAPISHEVHLFDWDGDIYGERVHVDVHFYVRPEMAFSDLTQLQKQIERDVNSVKEAFRLSEQKGWTSRTEQEAMIGL
ncbi:riboflavin kinase [Brevibacillus ruminantium]|uniref:riboflavin kinase n=1 Tax=Brevibacillus ruminantium TaxID=2950604 RepID=A0ABY4WQW1_9BACL|nr:riboflavin kinase [Brevibacillus ruminantium]USG67804.1 riboflavin kinase [Brevibacillus ruminantium]